MFQYKFDFNSICLINVYVRHEVHCSAHITDSALRYVVADIYHWPSLNSKSMSAENQLTFVLSQEATPLNKNEDSLKKCLRCFAYAGLLEKSFK